MERAHLNNYLILRPFQLTPYILHTAREGEDGRLCDISSNSCVKLWFMDLVRSLSQVSDNFSSKFKDRSRSESPLFCCEQRYSDVTLIVKHFYYCITAVACHPVLRYTGEKINL